MLLPVPAAYLINLSIYLSALSYDRRPYVVVNTTYVMSLPLRMRFGSHLGSAID